MKIVFMGSPAFAAPALEKLLASEHTVITTLSQPPRKSGRGMKEQKTPIHKLAEENGVPVLTPEKLGPEAQAHIKEIRPDLIAVAAYGLLLPQEVLDVAPCLNIHPSALPRWRGAAPLNWTIMAGDKTTEVCVMQMVKALDAGAVYARRPLELAPDETAGTLHDKAANVGAELLLEVVNNWDNYKGRAEPQHEDGVTYANKIEKPHRKTDFTRTSDEVANHINGLSPFPAATAELDDTAFKLLLAEAVAGNGTPGEVLHADQTQGLVVACGSGAVRLKKLQKHGKPPMEDTAFLRGNPTERGQFS